jgi:hypothetical protein
MPSRGGGGNSQGVKQEGVAGTKRKGGHGSGGAAA